MNERIASTLKGLKLTGLALAGLSFCGVTHAQQAGDPAAEAPFIQPLPEPIEEVIVTGQRTISSLLNEGARETENFYMRLNEVLNNPDFMIRCDDETPPGSNIRERVCRMRYQEELDSREALSFIQGVGTSDEGELIFTGSEFDSLPEAMRMQRQFEEELLVAVNTDLELNRSVVRLMQLKAAVQNYESPLQERRRLEREQRE